MTRTKINRGRRSSLESALAWQLKAEGIPYDTEFAFHPKRKWRFDFVLLHPRKNIAVECEGGLWNTGRHQRPQGFTDDCEKYNEAACDDWAVIRVTKEQIKSGQAIEWIKRLMG